MNKFFASSDLFVRPRYTVFVGILLLQTSSPFRSFTIMLSQAAYMSEMTNSSKTLTVIVYIARCMMMLIILL